MAAYHVGVDVLVKFGDSRSNGFRDIRGAVFALNERTNEHDDAYIPIARNLKSIKYYFKYYIKL